MAGFLSVREMAAHLASTGLIAAPGSKEIRDAIKQTTLTHARPPNARSRRRKAT